MVPAQSGGHCAMILMPRVTDCAAIARFLVALTN
jgi:hypothetical protein